VSAFQATYSDLRIVKGRKVVQILLEVPQESADAALAVLGGLPRPDSPVWVGVARLDPKASKEAPQKEKRRFDELPLPQQAALLGQDERFHRWVERPNGTGTWRIGNDPEAGAAQYIRTMCDIGSRAELTTNREAAEKFRILVQRYRTETGQMAEKR